MSGERTEAPTRRRLRRARARGQTAVSPELTGAAGLLGGLAALAAAGPALAGQLGSALRSALEGAALSPPAPAAALAAAGAAILRAAAVPAAGAAAGVLLAGLLQTGFLFAPGALRPRLERLDPWRGLRRLASPAQLGGAALGLCKAAVLLAVGAIWLREAAPGLAALPRPGPAGPWGMAGAAWGLAARLGLAWAALGLIDLLRARRRHLRSLRVSRDELRRELREDEGDPALRAERRRLHRGLAQAAPLSRATVVIVNPTHVAVALRHERGGPDAPRVLAKGTGRAAARIRSAARRAGIPVLRQPALARALLALAEVGAEIPEELYQAAAVVLAHLYRAGAPC